MLKMDARREQLRNRVLALCDVGRSLFPDELVEVRRLNAAVDVVLETQAAFGIS